MSCALVVVVWRQKCDARFRTAPRPATFSRIGMNPGDQVLPGNNYVFRQAITAPAGEQMCILGLQMVEEFVEYFGDLIEITVDVSDPPNPVRYWFSYE